MRSLRPPRLRAVLAIGALLCAGISAGTASAAAATGGTAATTTTTTTATTTTDQPLSARQRAVLRGIARETWAFFRKDVDPATSLPLDNLGPGQTRGTYTSASNVGVYLWAVISAMDLGLIDRSEARARISATLRGVSGLQRSHGFLYQWYDTTSGHVILGPGQADCPTPSSPPARDNCSFLSAVDNGWYASGLIVVRQALPELRTLVNGLITPMDFSIFYDDRAQTDCNTNPDITGNQPTGQMFGGFYVGTGPADYHNGALYSDPRIAMYLGMGLHQMPGDVWWRTWRTLPPQRCGTDPDFSWQGQWPVGGYWQDYRDPQSGKVFPVWEGHYTYPGSDLTFLPTWAGGMFEALMANEVVPETAWGPRGFGLADRRTPQVQIKYATEQLHFPIWGLSPSSTADDSGGYGSFGVEGQLFPAGQQLAQCTGCGTETTVTPHASFLALSVAPRQAYANIARMRTLYPDSYTADGGFYDAIDPVTGAVGHRRLVLDQSMIMAALDNALNGGALQNRFAADPVSWAARRYLSMETMSLG